MRKIKVLVIDDSAFMRRIISDIINEDDKCEVVATAKNGIEALEFIKKYKPDVMTLDVEMPLLNGIDVLKQIDKSNFVPTIMLSSTTKEGATVTIQALELGAIDFIKKPTNIFNVNSDEIRENIINKIITASKVRINKIYRSDNQEIESFNIRNKNTTYINMTNTNSMVKNIVAIGTSTGGPKALKSVLPLLPSNINASIIVVQHMPAGFTKSLAERLDSISNMKIKEAEHGEVLLNGIAYIAPGGRHIAVNNVNNKFVIVLSDEEPVRGHRPSVDVMMNSVVDVSPKNLIGVIMTGMGSDGSEAIDKMKKSNKSYVIAQSEETCVVYGMPKSVVENGNADEVVSLNKIYESIINRTGVL